MEKYLFDTQYQVPVFTGEWACWLTNCCVCFHMMDHSLFKDKQEMESALPAIGFLIFQFSAFFCAILSWSSCISCLTFLVHANPKQFITIGLHITLYNYWPLKSEVSKNVSSESNSSWGRIDIMWFNIQWSAMYYYTE